MHSEKIHPIGAMEIEMRDGMIAFEFRENRLPVGEQLRSIARFQGLACSFSDLSSSSVAPSMVRLVNSLR